MSVLVIEYGDLDGQKADILVPGLANSIPYAFNLSSVPQRNLNGRPTTFTTGAVVGGSSAINGMVFQRAPARDYDAFIELGNPGWGFKDLLPYFKKVFEFIFMRASPV